MIYELPKITKSNIPLRPIISGINTASHNIAKHNQNIKISIRDN